MRSSLRAAAGSILSVGLVLLASPGTARAQRGNTPKVADAKPGEVRLMATSAIRGPIEAIRAEAERAIGHPLLIEFGSARGNLRDEILGGQAFEVAIVLSDVLDDAAAQGKIVPESRFDVAHVDVAIGQRGAAPKVDISTPNALKKAMLEAKSVKWAATGAALPGTNNILDSLTLRDAIKDRSNLRGEVPLGPGEYELVINPLSEIMTNPNLQNLGPVPSAVNIPVVMTGAIGSMADRKTAEQLVAFLKGDAILSALTASGMTR